MKKLTHEEFVNKVLSINSNIEILNIYQGSLSRIQCKCKICKNKWDARASNLYRYGCPKCRDIKNAQQFKNSLDKVLYLFKLAHGDKYDYNKMKYINCDTKIKIICPIHGEFRQRPNDHMNKKCGCPKCSRSHGESIIEKYLKENHIKYIDLYKISIPENIRVSKSTFIDFYLPDYNIFIEYNGILHYIPLKYFGGLLKFDKQIIRDNFVRNYCKENNIKLLEIPYKLNLEEILELLNNNI